jgi:hypothetical protein
VLERACRAFKQCGAQALALPVLSPSVQGGPSGAVQFIDGDGVVVEVRFRGGGDSRAAAGSCPRP